MTTVHVNRTLRELRKADLVSFRGRPCKGDQPQEAGRNNRIRQRVSQVTAIS
ncbi:hypothetical protein [Mesorhizobium sp.]|uniref:hypothetical protein n=1 Tax=Mesorhizobium sp. TaxID=1871066 RepID=UPI00257D309D|nr:hypothetical protein [Mesorhizobium sp.]